MYTNIHIYIPARRYQALKLYDLNRSGNGGDDYNDGSSTPKTIAIEMDKKKSSQFGVISLSILNADYCLYSGGRRYTNFDDVLFVCFIFIRQ